MDENTPKGEAADDAYVIEDTGSSVEEIEREMRETAEEAAEAPAPAPAPAADDDALRAENQQLKDKYLRTLADFDNLRKRTEREKADFFRYAMGGVLKDILPVLDNFDRALDHAAEGDEFHKGVLLIYKQLFDVLEKHGLKPIDESGVHFDPNIHEAVVREEDDSVPSHTVVAVLQKGYFLHDRLLRPALVKVAVGGPDRTT
ncbi:MAG TPA: nucleotide exchange factor GrpE [Thermoanaerobaculia bacterium]|jgi:molecular chaperone GrpE|nr:nucleotide exchange factor GrpE [Thermoanaerobaculia bacterium]